MQLRSSLSAAWHQQTWQGNELNSSCLQMTARCQMTPMTPWATLPEPWMTSTLSPSRVVCTGTTAASSTQLCCRLACCWEGVHCLQTAV